MRKMTAVGSFFALTALLLCGSAGAVTIKYTATDLSDVVIGQDRWALNYKLTGSFSAFEGLNLLFPYARFNDLVLAAAPDPAVWSALLTPPDAGLGADGLLTLGANANANVTDLPFGIEFTWLGSGVPGIQEFELFDANFSITGSARTSAANPSGPGNPAPEPGTLALIAGALFLLARPRWRRCAPAMRCQPA